MRYEASTTSAGYRVPLMQSLALIGLSETGKEFRSDA